MLPLFSNRRQLSRLEQLWVYHSEVILEIVDNLILAARVYPRQGFELAEL